MVRLPGSLDHNRCLRSSRGCTPVDAYQVDHRLVGPHVGENFLELGVAVTITSVSANCTTCAMSGASRAAMCGMRFMMKSRLAPMSAAKRTLRS